MPFSHPENKSWILDKIKELQPTKVLDVGAGAGYIEKLLRDHFQKSLIIDGIEIWEPYISKYNLLDRYDNLFNVNAKEWDNWDYDVIIFGDVLEHMTEQEAADLWTKASKASYAIITIPIIHYPQGAEFNNPYEVHIEEDWNTERVLSVFSNIIEYKEFSTSGAYLAKFK